MIFAQNVVYLAPDGGSSEDSAALDRQLIAALAHSQQPATRRSASLATAETLRDAYEAVQRLDGARRAEALAVLNTLAAELAKFDLSRVPAVTAVPLDDGSLVLEWIFADRRLGLSFDPKPGESGWFFVSSPERGNVRAHGRFDGINLGLLATMALASGPH